MQENAFAKFMTSESGAITVDWVILTAGICLMGVVMVGMVVKGQNQVGDSVEQTLTAGSSTLGTVKFD